MIGILSRCFIMGLILVFAFGCGESQTGQGQADQVLQSFSEGCSLCHGAGSTVDVAVEHATAAGTITGEITNVTVVGAVTTVFFTITSGQSPIIGIDANSSPLSTGSIRFTIAQLDATGNWQSYINTTETKAAGDPGTTADGNTAVQATYEKADDSDGTFAEVGSGAYTYQFSFDITSVTTPLAVTYTDTLTHRVAMQVSDNVANAFYDFRPSDGAIAGITTRDIAMNASCNECHVKLGFHGSDRIQVEYCVTCHNPGSADAHSDNTVDFDVMIHKIHTGEDLPEVEAGGAYTIWGYNESENDYSTVVYPQDSRNCTKCHDGADADTPDGDNWKDEPSTSACTSCHEADAVSDDYPAFPALTAAEITTAHVIPEQVAAQNLELNILEVTTAAGTGGALDVTIQFSVTDPLNSDLEYDIMDTDPLDLTPLSFLIGWDTTDYTNTGSGSTPAQAVGVSVTNATGDANNIFTLTVSDAVPAGVTGSGVVGLQGHPYSDQNGDGDIDDRIPVKSVFKSFDITDATAQDRRAVVDIDNCNNCHQSLSLHGSNRTDEIQVCVMCHNPDATDVSVRPTDGTATTDGKTEEAIDMKYMIHAIHAADNDQHGFREDGIVVYGYRGSINDFSHVRYPGNLQNCGACHTGSTYEVPIDENALPTTIKTGSDPAVPNDDTKITPTAAVCSSCHDSLSARTHMTEEGGRFDLSYTAEGEASAGGPSGTQPAGHSDRTDCSSCHS